MLNFQFSIIISNRRINKVKWRWTYDETTSVKWSSAWEVISDGPITVHTAGELSQGPVATVGTELSHHLTGHPGDNMEKTFIIKIQRIKVPWHDMWLKGWKCNVDGWKYEAVLSPNASSRHHNGGGWMAPNSSVLLIDFIIEQQTGRGIQECYKKLLSLFHYFLFFDLTHSCSIGIIFFLF